MNTVTEKRSSLLNLREEINCEKFIAEEHTRRVSNETNGGWSRWIECICWCGPWAGSSLLWSGWFRMWTNQALIRVQLCHHFSHTKRRVTPDENRLKWNRSFLTRPPVIWFTITKTLSKWIRGDLQLRDTMILIGRHADELRFGEGERSKCLSLLQKWIVRLRRWRVNTMNARLIAMHRVENDLGCSMKYNRIDEENGLFGLRVRSHRVDYWSVWVCRTRRHFSSRLHRFAANPDGRENDRDRVDPLCRQLPNWNWMQRQKKVRAVTLASSRLPVKGVSIALIIQGNEIHHQQIRGWWIHAIDLHLQDGKHSSTNYQTGNIDWLADCFENNQGVVFTVTHVRSSRENSFDWIIRLNLISASRSLLMTHLNHRGDQYKWEN